MSPNYYSEKDARDILKLATEIETRERDFSEEHLRQMAEELGISEQSLVLAKEQHLAEREQRVEEEVREELRIEFDRYRQKSFRVHLTVFALIMTLLVGINLLTSPAFLWFFFPLFGMAAGLLGHYWGIQQNEGSFYEQQFDQWLSRNKEKRKLLAPFER